MKTVLVLFGGRSSEHEVSCISAKNIVSEIDKTNYKVELIGITKDGTWKYVSEQEDFFKNTWCESGVGVYLKMETEQHIMMTSDNKKIEVDVVFPILHGLYGEDGTIQGLLKLLMIPFVGCSVLASAVSMNKYYTKQIIEHAGIRQAKYLALKKEESLNIEEVISKCERELSYPIFIKPCNSGSSKGITKAYDNDMVRSGIEQAFACDDFVIIEEMIKGREIECSVLRSNKGIEVSGVGEIISLSDFYDYQTKYYDDSAKIELNPELSKEKSDEIRELTLKIFTAVDGYGMARVDFFLTDEGVVVFNEINTIPGFTKTSMYPKLWENVGIRAEVLINMLIESAFERQL